jgi:hypothetical protein
MVQGRSVRVRGSGVARAVASDVNEGSSEGTVMWCHRGLGLRAVKV